MKQKAAIIAAAAIVALLFSACQPTPEEEVVIDNGSALAADEVSGMDPDFDLTSMLEAVPERWDEELSMRDGSVNIKIGADIDFPEVSAIPIVRMTPASFELEKLEAVVALLGGEGAYLAMPPQNSEGYALPAPEEYEKWIADTTATLQKLAEEYGGNYAEEIAAYIDELEADRKRLTEELAAHDGEEARKVEDYESLSGTFQFEAYILDKAGDKVTNIQVGLRGRPQDDVRESFIFASEQSAPVVNEPIGSLEEAVEVGARVLEVLGIKESYDLVSIVGGGEAYDLSYGRSYKGIAYSPLVNKRIAYESEYSPAWVDERLRIVFITGSGRLNFFHWWGYGQTEEELSANAELCGFDEIQAACEKHLSSVFSWRPDEIAATNIEIDRISLGYMRVKLQNATGGYALIPAWTFQGRITNTYREGFGYIAGVPARDPIADNVVLVLSALDGGLIYSPVANK